MTEKKITTGKLTLTLHADVIMDEYDQYDGDLSPDVARIIKAYGGEPDPSDDFWGLAEEDSILRHNETGALLIVGLLDHPYAAEELEGKIRIVTTSHPEGEDIMGELEHIGELDATLETYDPPSFDGDGAEVILKGSVSLEGLDDINALSWVSEVTVS
jgi:hypothetical protein